MEIVKSYILKTRSLVISDPESNCLLLHGSGNDVFSIKEEHIGLYKALLNLLKIPSSTKELLHKLEFQGISLTID